MPNIDKNFFKETTILCVEDDDGVRDNLVLFLKRRFKEVYEAKDGLEGLEKYNQYLPDIVMTDIQMPKLNGLEMSKRIREQNWLVPIIVVSAFEDLEYLKEAIEIGIGSYVTKPVDSERLIDRLYKSTLVSKYQKQQHQLEESEELFRTIIVGSPNGIILFKEKFIYANKAFEELVGYSINELKEMSLNDFVLSLEDKKMLDSSLKRRLAGEKFESVYQDILIQSKSGDLKHISISANTIKYKGEYVGVANIIDITERKWFEQEINQKKSQLEELNMELKQNILLIEQKNLELQEQYYTDKLTKLPNRFKLLETIKKYKKPALILLNIDAFKEINDFYGSEAGDIVLHSIAIRLKEHIKNTDFELYKLQADEYAICGDGDYSKEYLESFIKRIHDDIDNYNMEIYGQNISVRITAGISIDTPSSVLAKADIALKAAKKKHKDYIFYDDSMMIMKEFEQNIKWVNVLKKALEDNRIVSYFQPIINNQTGKIEKFESLVRLIGEDGKVYSPFYFLEVSKRARLYHQITKRVMLDSINVFKNREYEFSINLSIEDIMDERMYEFILSEIKKDKIGKKMVFEILESDGIDNYEVVAQFIKEVKNYGCKVAIDDFGSGYSNFAHLLALDVDYIKIDASIIKKTDTDRNSQIISQTIVDFSKRLNIKTVAEFVHSKEVFSVVKSFGIDYSQGYYIGEPKREID